MKKMKNTIFSLFACAMFLALTACTTKEAAINNLEKFSYELRDKSRNYGVKDWEIAANQFISLRKDISRHNYNEAEHQRIRRLEGECAKYMAKGAKDGILDKVLEVGAGLQGILEGLGF